MPRIEDNKIASGKSSTVIISKLCSEIRACMLCRLSKGRTNAVPGSGKIQDLDLMFVGEGPGRNEDQMGLPFVGAGGKLLDLMLREAGLDRSNIYITNMVKCRPPDNRKPERDEVEICASNYLEKQIDILKPKLICTLGATALEYFIGKVSIGRNHGKLTRSVRGLWIFPTYHPAAIFRSNDLREVLQEDIKQIPLILKRVKQDGQKEMTSFL